MNTIEIGPVTIYNVNQILRTEHYSNTISVLYLNGFEDDVHVSMSQEDYKQLVQKIISLSRR